MNPDLRSQLLAEARTAPPADLERAVRRGEQRFVRRQLTWSAVATALCAGLVASLLTLGTGSGRAQLVSGIGSPVTLGPTISAPPAPPPTTAPTSPPTTPPSTGGAASPTLTGLVVTPGDHTMSPGDTVTMTASAHYSNGTTRSVTNLADWQTSNAKVVRIGPGGLAVAGSAGSATITANALGLTATARIVVAPIVTIAIDPAPLTLVVGQTRMLSIVGTDANDLARNIAASVVWDPAGSDVATVDRQGVVTALAPGKVLLTASEDGVHGTLVVDVTTSDAPSSPPSPVPSSSSTAPTLPTPP